MTDWPFGSLPMFRYRVGLIDIPWYYQAGGDRQASMHYPTLSMDELRAMPVGQLFTSPAAIFMWALDPMLDVAIDLGRHWGFRFVSVGFYWAKRTRLDTGWHMGTGYGTRANPEQCLLFMHGSMGLPNNRDVRRLVVEPLREHSRKPDRIHTDIERLYDGPYVELFGRARRPGWDVWGNEVDKFSGSEVEQQPRPDPKPRLIGIGDAVPARDVGTFDLFD